MHNIIYIIYYIMHFLQIKPNSDKYIDSVLADTILKLLKSDNLNISNESVSDMIELCEDYISELSNDDPIQYINSYFADINKTDEIKQYYDIMAINKSGTVYNLLLINNYLNISSMVSMLTDDERASKFNLIASSLTQYYNNSMAIFGDVFMISIDSSYYDLLEIMKDDNKNKTEIEYTLSTYKTIYFNFKFIDLFRTIASIYYINIYVLPLNQTVIYSRGILNNYITTNKPTIINNNIIMIEHTGMKLYMKITDILPNSHNHIILMIKADSDNYYLTNITNHDIELLNK